MESIVLSRKQIYRKYTVKSEGREADFFHLDETTGLKIFKKEAEVQATLPNKLKKVTKTAGMQLPGVVFPKSAVFEENGEFIGYTMDLVKTAGYISNFWDLGKPCFSLAQKVAFYKKFEALVVLVHSKSMKLVDTNPENFLIDASKRVCLIDTDNFMHNDCPCDLIPSYPAKYYARKTGDQSYDFVDEFSLAIIFLEIAVIGLYKEVLTSLVNGELFIIDEIVEDLDIPTELKLILLRVVSAAGKKEFIGPYLDCIASSSERYLKRRNSSLH